jgi:hypothetical protein
MRKLLSVMLLLLCGSMLQAQNGNGAAHSAAAKGFKAQHQEQVRTKLIGRMNLSADVKAKVEAIMDDFLSTVEKQQEDPSQITKGLIEKTMAARNKELRAVLGQQGMKQFLAYEMQMPSARPTPPGMNAKFAGN